MFTRKLMLLVHTLNYENILERTRANMILCANYPETETERESNRMEQ